MRMSLRVLLAVTIAFAVYRVTWIPAVIRAEEPQPAGVDEGNKGGASSVFPTTSPYLAEPQPAYSPSPETRKLSNIPVFDPYQPQPARPAQYYAYPVPPAIAKWEYRAVRAPHADILNNLFREGWEPLMMSTGEQQVGSPMVILKRRERPAEAVVESSTIKPGRLFGTPGDENAANVAVYRALEALGFEKGDSDKRVEFSASKKTIQRIKKSGVIVVEKDGKVTVEGKDEGGSRKDE